MGVLYVAFVLACGFLFTTLHLPARYKQKRSSGWESYFHVALWGFAWVIAAAVLVLIIDVLDLPSRTLPILGFNVETITANLGTYTAQEVTLRELFIAVVAFGLAAIAGGISALWTRNPGTRLRQLRKVCMADDLESLFLEAYTSFSTVLVTLDSRKCYVGLVIDVLTDEATMSSVAIIPTLSGYRAEKDLELVLPRNYYLHYERTGLLERSADYSQLVNFRIVIPIKNISHVSLFDHSQYQSLRDSQTADES